VLLVDLPGHGARFAEKLDLPSALAALEEVSDKEAPGQKVGLTAVTGFRRCNVVRGLQERDDVHRCAACSARCAQPLASCTPFCALP
jgi:hypothetical protein